MHQDARGERAQGCKKYEGARDVMTQEYEGTRVHRV